MHTIVRRDGFRRNEARERDDAGLPVGRGPVVSAG